MPEQRLGNFLRDLASSLGKLHGMRRPGANAAETTNKAGISIFFIGLPSLSL